MKNWSKPIPPMTEKEIARFWEKVDIRGKDECWPWNRPVHGHEYAKIGVGKRENRSTVLAHRVAYTITNGPIPPHLLCCHSCDTQLCCNPAHLWPGTDGDNMQDKVKKGRSRNAPQKGERNPRAKLNNKQVRWARKAWETGEYTQRKMADMLDVSESTIHRIVRGEGWTHVK